MEHESKHIALELKKFYFVQEKSSRDWIEAGWSGPLMFDSSSSESSSAHYTTGKGVYQILLMPLYDWCTLKIKSIVQSAIGSVFCCLAADSLILYISFNQNGDGAASKVLCIPDLF
jgi:hypothetical protein